MSDKDDIDRMIDSMVVDSPPAKKDQGSDKDCKEVCHTVCPGKKSCSGWCIPLYIHIFLSVLQFATIMMMQVYHPRKREYVNAPASVKARYAAICVVWNVLVGFAMYYLCKYCHQGWAWFVLLLPIILNTLILLLLVVTILYVSRHRRRHHQQSP
jgi:4-hydroxybenzoate polyprenyltransferase